jgi:hypothetical protein
MVCRAMSEEPEAEAGKLCVFAWQKLVADRLFVNCPDDVVSRRRGDGGAGGCGARRGEGAGYGGVRGR